MPDWSGGLTTSVIGDGTTNGIRCGDVRGGKVFAWMANRSLGEYKPLSLDKMLSLCTTPAACCTEEGAWEGTWEEENVG
jgi:hypothetical protein